LKSSGIKWESKTKWPEFVDVVGQAEQKCLFALGGKRTARRLGGEFAFDCAEDCFSMHAFSVALGWKSGTHLRTHATQFPARLAAFSRNDALCADLLADVPVIAFGIELGLG